MSAMKSASVMVAARNIASTRFLICGLAGGPAFEASGSLSPAKLLDRDMFLLTVALIFCMTALAV